MALLLELLRDDSLCFLVYSTVRVHKRINSAQHPLQCVLEGLDLLLQARHFLCQSGVRLLYDPRKHIRLERKLRETLHNCVFELFCGYGRNLAVLIPAGVPEISLVGGFLRRFRVHFLEAGSAVDHIRQNVCMPLGRHDAVTCCLSFVHQRLNLVEKLPVDDGLPRGLDLFVLLIFTGVVHRVEHFFLVYGQQPNVLPAPKYPPDGLEREQPAASSCPVLGNSRFCSIALFVKERHYLSDGPPLKVFLKHQFNYCSFLRVRNQLPRIRSKIEPKGMRPSGPPSLPGTGLLACFHPVADLLTLEFSKGHQNNCDEASIERSSVYLLGHADEINLVCLQKVEKNKKVPDRPTHPVQSRTHDSVHRAGLNVYVKLLEFLALNGFATRNALENVSPRQFPTIRVLLRLVLVIDVTFHFVELGRD